MIPSSPEEGARPVSELSDRLLRVALLGVVPDDDQSVIADAQAEIERLTEALSAARREEREAILLLIPGGQICDPQEIADSIRARDVSLASAIRSQGSE